MILYSDKHFITNSDHPNDDWIGDADWVLDDNIQQLLTQKIISLYPNFEIVTDDEGNVTDVVEIEPVITPEQLEAYKEKRIQESKLLLAQWLNDNPFLYTDGKYYSCSEEKQALLNGNLASYERATKAGIEYPLKWNSTGSECVSWEYSDLLTLSLNIAGYVAPKVSIQQSVELQIKACETIEQIDAVEINYD